MTGADIFERFTKGYFVVPKPEGGISIFERTSIFQSAAKQVLSKETMFDKPPKALKKYSGGELVTATAFYFEPFSMPDFENQQVFSFVYHLAILADW